MSGKIDESIRQLIKKAPFQKAVVKSTDDPPKDKPKRRQEWSIGIYVGESPLHFVPPRNVNNPVLTRNDVSDINAAFVADPFMLRVAHRWYMFFEVKNVETGKGEIGLALSDDGLKWTYQQIVIAEPFHLSYPYVFEWMNDYYMIPECRRAKAIRLYKAVTFPTQWSLVGTLLRGSFVDASIFHNGDRWWLFTETNPEPKWDTLCLYHADNLMGPWVPHLKSPIIQGNAHIARPAGRVLRVNGRIIRYAQDCFPIYGTQVKAFEITELSATNYYEREADNSPVLNASGTGWNESGMHHIDPHPLPDGGWIACVDGFFWQELDLRVGSSRTANNLTEKPRP